MTMFVARTPVLEPEPEAADRLLEAVEGLREALAMLPAPQVHVAAPDLGEIVQAVTSLRPGVTAEEIADAIAERLHIPEPEPTDLSVLSDLAKTLERLEFRLKAPQQAFGSSGPSNIADNPDRLLGKVEVLNPSTAEDTRSRAERVLKAAPSAGEEVRLESTATDDYTGMATDAADTTAAVWDVIRAYKTGVNVTRIRFRSGIKWSERTAGW